jgi:hypothetical protein
MKRQLQFIAVFAAFAASPAGAQQTGPFLPAPGADPHCDQGAPDSDTITICGKRDHGDRYRIPEDLRASGQIDSRDMARSALERDSRSLAAYGSQTVGPFGARQYSRQVRCEWVAERQMQQGRQIDCTAKARADRPGDWTRDRR